MLVARVSTGAKVITVTGSREAPASPGRTPQPDISDAPAATAAVQASRMREEVGEVRGEVERRLPVMAPYASCPGGTPL
ncbi:hypothetical protein GCM10023329_26250 [Streptomyces sanyensis]|uniref:Uncharacterized protein n=1 Tax=Streptomyces sanyensis TaxID=568869 RepID=A0ABP9A8V9_9ACTN